MKSLKLIQNQIEKFNILGNEKSLEFLYAIVDDEGKSVERDGVKCQLHYSTQEDIEDTQIELSDYAKLGEVDNILYIITKPKGSWSTADKEDTAKRLAFVDEYLDSFDELKESFEAKRKPELEKQIERLQADLANCSLPKATYEAADIIKEESEKLQKSADNYRKWREEYKEESEKYQRYTTDADAAETQAKVLFAKYESHLKVLEAV